MEVEASSGVSARVRLAALVTVLTTGVFVASGSRAQTAPPPAPRTPAVVPSSSELAPLQVRPDGETRAPDAPPPPRELGKPEDEVRVDVTRYVVDDNAPAELRQALAALTQRYTGPARSFEDLVSAAGEVTRFLQRDLGYYLGYAYLPEQTPSDGVIRIAVLEGRLDRVELLWPADMLVDRAVVEAYLARLVEGSILKVRDIERVVFLVNDLRGMTATFEIRPGRQPGTAALVVTARPESVWSGKAEVDANGSRFLGLYRLGGLVQMNSPFGRGDGLTANALVSTTGGLGFALLGYTTPLGSDGWKVGASLSAVRYQLDKDIFALNLRGSATTLNAYALYPVVRSRNLNLFTLASYEHKTYEDKAASTQVKKSVDTLALGATGDFRDSLLGGGVSTYDLSLVAGKVKYPEGIPGGLDDAPNFTKLLFGYTRLQDIVTGRVLGYVALRGQVAQKNLDTTEQFRLGGPEGVRAYAPGEGTGDSGALLSLELRILPPEAWLGRVAREMVASVFFDAGYVRYRHEPRINPDTIAPDPNTEVFTGAGIGLSWVRPDGYSLRVSLSKPLSGTPRSDPKERDPRLYLLVSKQFD